MKSNTRHTAAKPDHAQDLEQLRSTLNREKEALVSMFLANAPLTQLNAQYQLIDELNEKIHKSGRDWFPVFYFSFQLLLNCIFACQFLYSIYW